MSDPVIGKLARFTPESALDRDALLFQAGRASVRTPGMWKWAVATLTVSQVFTLALLLGGGTPKPRPASPVEPVATESLQPDPTSIPEPISYAVLIRNFDPDAPPKFPSSGGGAKGPQPAPFTAGWRGKIE
ncbi:MAG TPA: hypothetical protein VGJ05_03035 [Fimbriiglobus sp.]|jgi:hypothetical protein